MKKIISMLIVLSLCSYVFAETTELERQIYHQHLIEKQKSYIPWIWQKETKKETKKEFIDRLMLLDKDKDGLLSRKELESMNY